MAMQNTGFSARRLAALWLGALALPLPALAMPNLQGTEWRMVEPAPAGQPPTVAFQPGKMTGFAGCNRFIRTVDAKGKAQVATTRMACRPPLMEMEQHFIAFLSSPFRVLPDGRAQTLVLKSERAEYRFVRLSPNADPAAQPAKLQYLYVAPERQACHNGEASRDCLQVRERAEQSWRPLQGEIAGFHPKPGVSYYIKLKPAAQADAGSRWTLERIVYSEEVSKLR
ncbi:META domain-containing protein [Chromobacterium haemolyticum]|uniref:META domain-containing protein n=2 Tax=Chromobacterium TaxID=535 RepID=A0AAD0RWJ5_9NEIS|nr:META domain-containing protein [Chromobacterium rhizoryzae]PTU68099.1 META domain-containing protein [Chromobacterium haemolyticum]